MHTVKGLLERCVLLSLLRLEKKSGEYNYSLVLHIEGSSFLAVKKKSEVMIT